MSDLKAGAAAISKMRVSWKQCITTFTEAPSLAKADQPLVMGQTICEWRGWKRGR